MKIEKTIDRESRQKLYVQIYAILKEKITGGKWTAGAQIPTEDDLCKMYEVSKVTVREAIQELVREGHLKRQQGKGTFVSESLTHQGLVMRTRLTDSLEREGVTARREILERGVGKPSKEIRDILLSDEDMHLILCRNTQDTGEFLEQLYIPLFELESITDDDIVRSRVSDLLEDRGTKKISKVLQIMGMGNLDRKMATWFTSGSDAHVLIVQRIFLSSDGMPIAFFKYMTGGKNRVSIEFEKIK